MLLGRVIGALVPACVSEGLEGVPMLIVQPLDAAGGDDDVAGATAATMANLPVRDTGDAAAGPAVVAGVEGSAATACPGGNLGCDAAV